MNLAPVILKPVLRRAARRAWIGRNRAQGQPEVGRFTASDVDRLLRQTWRNYAELSPSQPHEPTSGSRQVIILACVTLAAFRALLSEGVARDYAIELVADAGWQIYERCGVIPRLIARRQSHDPLAQMRIMVGLFLRYPFNPPGYQFEVSTSGDAVEITIYRCPIAEYMRSHGTTDLCVGAWCGLDYALAELWGGSLHRTRTLAGNDAPCDFRFIINHADALP